MALLQLLLLWLLSFWSFLLPKFLWYYFLLVLLPLLYYLEVSFSKESHPYLVSPALYVSRTSTFTSVPMSIRSEPSNCCTSLVSHPLQIKTFQSEFIICPLMQPVALKIWDVVKGTICYPIIQVRNCRVMLDNSFTCSSVIKYDIVSHKTCSKSKNPNMSWINLLFIPINLLLLP